MIAYNELKGRRVTINGRMVGGGGGGGGMGKMIKISKNVYDGGRKTLRKKKYGPNDLCLPTRSDKKNHPVFRALFCLFQPSRNKLYVHIIRNNGIIYIYKTQ